MYPPSPFQAQIPWIAAQRQDRSYSKGKRRFCQEKKNKQGEIQNMITERIHAEFESRPAESTSTPRRARLAQTDMMQARKGSGIGTYTFN
jgi:hypothetical protein